MTQFKIYCSIKPANNTKFFDLLVERLTANIQQLTENGYWFEPCKIVIHKEEQRIDFGYPYALVKKIFSTTFQSELRLDPNRLSSIYELGFLIQGGRREELCKQEPLTFHPPYQFQLETRLTEDWLTKKIAKLDELYCKADKYEWSNIDYVPEEEHLSAKTFEAIFGAPLNKKILVLGEYSHVGGRYLNFLCEHIEKLKELGVGTLAIEALFYKFHQKALDHYFDSELDELPIELKQYIISSYIEPIKQFKKAGIRIIGLDHLASVYAGYHNFGYISDQRNTTFNSYAAEIIKKEVKEGEAGIAFVGLSHAVDRDHGIVGLPCLVPQALSVGLATPSQESSNRLQSNYSFQSPTSGARLSTHFFDRPRLKSEETSTTEASLTIKA